MHFLLRGVMIYMRENYDEQEECKMAVISKSNNLAFFVSDEKSQEFLSEKPNNEMLLKKFKRLRQCALLSGKSADDDEIKYFDKKINELSLDKK